MKTKPNKYWNKEKCVEEAYKYKTRKEFFSNCHSAYNKCYKEGWLDEVCLHMIDGRTLWNKEKSLNAAKTCETRSEFAKKYPSAYDLCI